MQKYVGSGTGRVVLMNLHRDELLLESVKKAVEEEGITHAVVQGIGTVKTAHVHRVLSTEVDPKEKYFSVDGPFEVGTIQGAIVDGKPHLHLVMDDGKQVIAAHLEEGTQSLYVTELVITEIKGLDYLTRIRQNNIPELAERV